MGSDILLREDAGGICRLTLNAPASYNTLSDEMLDALNTALTAIAADETVRVVVLAANGKAFSAGHDLKQMQAHRNAPDGGATYFNGLFGRCGGVMEQIATLPQPVIAEVAGIATAAGCQMVASCDMAVAAEGVRFGVNGVNLGLFCTTPGVALGRNVARKHALEMLITGEFIDATRAREIGLINRVVPAEELTEATMRLAGVVAGKLPSAVRAGKAAFNAQIGLPLAEAYALAAPRMAENMMDPDTAEGIQAFIEKRPPSWGGSH